MKEQDDKKNTGIQRYFITSHRTSSLQVITFDRLLPEPHAVRILNISVAGVGVESKKRIEPGLACFMEPVGGQKFGVVAWCKEFGNTYRAGINFVTLPQDKAQYILNLITERPADHALRDPEKVISKLLDSIREETNG